MSKPDQSFESLERRLAAFADQLSLDREMRRIAGSIRDEARNELARTGNCDENNQALIASLRVEPGTRRSEYVVMNDGNYGLEREFGTTNTPESPWFIPALVMVAGSIRNCLLDAFNRALMKARRPYGMR